MRPINCIKKIMNCESRYKNWSKQWQGTEQFDCLIVCFVAIRSPMALDLFPVSKTMESKLTELATQQQRSIVEVVTIVHSLNDVTAELNRCMPAYLMQDILTALLAADRDHNFTLIPAKNASLVHVAAKSTRHYSE